MRPPDSEEMCSERQTPFLPSWRHQLAKDLGWPRPARENDLGLALLTGA